MCWTTSRNAAPDGTASADLLVGSLGGDKMEGQQGNDIMNGASGKDVVNGGTGGDRLQGGRDSDRLIGGAGNDTLTGGEGRDTLTGGNGRDTFKFVLPSDSPPGEKGDIITDFNFGIDRIDLRDVIAGELTFRGVTGINGVGQVAVRDFVSGEQSGTIVMVNLRGDTNPDMEIRVNNVAALDFVAFDFLL
jgi:serralysin